MKFSLAIEHLTLSPDTSRIRRVDWPITKYVAFSSFFRPDGHYAPSFSVSDENGHIYPGFAFSATDILSSWELI